jgi:ATP-dependent Lhr-like helicase
LGAGLEQSTGKKWVAGNLSLRCKDIALEAAERAVGHLAALDWSSVAAEAAKSVARGTISKFQPCLPLEAERRLLAERLVDQKGAVHFLGSVKVKTIRVASR